MLLQFFHRPKLELVVDRGRVACPLRGCDVEVDLCMRCERLQSLDDTGERPVVRCMPRRPVASLGAY